MHGRNHVKPINLYFMKKFNKLDRAEMKAVLGGLLNPNDNNPHPKDDPECMTRTNGDKCGGNVSGTCSKVYDYASKEYYLRCDFDVTVPEPS
jgi:hypothetical protein